AAPYHDWNERIYDQCYRPNAHSRIVDPAGLIQDIHNNFRYLSFNFGPTLFRWLEKEHPRVAESIIEADRESCRRLEGHGNALAQAYNHIILPLASRRDQLTQIRWGKAYFRSRFGRDPEGMWLSETAINAETVRCLIEEEIKFVVLAPTQADAIRRIGEEENGWRSNDHQQIDTRRAYRIWLPEGEAAGGYLDAFFFDEELSRSVSFGNLLIDAGMLGGRIESCFDPNGDEPQAAILATDGETFGHHKPYGDMCLAYLYAHIAHDMNLEPVSFGYFLAKHPPRYEVQLRNADADGCAWSCAHGTGRWARDCGCQTGGYPEWNQKWRAPLRRALDELQRELDRTFERELGPLVDDPWRLRDDYVLLKDGIEYQSTEELLTAHGAGVGGSRAHERALKLMAAQAYMLYAYTSCGWFFADISGIETVQNLQYACRAAQLGLEGSELETALEEFLQILDTAKSNMPDQTGKTICERYALPLMRSMEIMAFAAAATAPITRKEVRRTIDGYETVVRPDYLQNGEVVQKADRFAVKVKCARTGESGEFEVKLIGPGALRIMAVVTRADGDRKGFPVELTPADLFVGSRKKLTEAAVASLENAVDKLYREWMKQNEETISALATLNVPLPSTLHCPASHALNGEWSRLFEELNEPGRENEIFERLLPVWNKARSLGVRLETAEAGALIDERLRREIGDLAKELNGAACDRIRNLLGIAERFNIGLSKNRIEDAYFGVLDGPVRALYARYCQGKIGEEKTILLCALGLARRLNFSIERFPIS
ncbi:MAG: DUF3536 domain-containing protein, partial [Chitinivibrionales bacterium]|nr:DUF3536 domain-containing protein [Chitinivibrionales bacterium]MBD3356296.1 DUF3536 domain-containing protein [Chitinivibrionales bacterium]